MHCGFTARILRNALPGLVLLTWCVAAQAEDDTLAGAVGNLADTVRYKAYEVKRLKWKACTLPYTFSGEKKRIAKCGYEPEKPEGYDEWAAAIKEERERRKVPLEPLRDGRPGGWFRASWGPGSGPAPLAKGAVLPHPPAGEQ